MKSMESYGIIQMYKILWNPVKSIELLESNEIIEIFWNLIESYEIHRTLRNPKTSIESYGTQWNPQILMESH